MSDISPSQFAVVMRGYDRAQVEARLAQLERSLKEARSRVEDLDSRTKVLAGELSESQRRLRDSERASFAGIGARIEKLVHGAEEEAAEMVGHATEEAEGLRAAAQQERLQTQQDVAELRALAEAEAEQVRDLAAAEAQQVRGLAAEDAARVTAQASERARALVDTAETESTRLRAEVERLVIEAREVTEREVAGRTEAAEAAAAAVVAEAQDEARREREVAAEDVARLHHQQQAVTDHLDQLRTLLDRTRPPALDASARRSELGAADTASDGGHGSGRHEDEVVDGEVEDGEDLIDLDSGGRVGSDTLRRG